MEVTPMPMTSTHRPVLSVHIMGAATQARVVPCGTQLRTVGLAECKACPGFIALEPNAQGDTEVRCLASPTPRAAPRRDAGDQPVTQILRRRGTVVAEDADLETAAALIVELNLGGLVVVDAERRPIGTLTSEDLLRDRVLADGVHVRDAMTPTTVAVDDFTSVLHAAHVMAELGLQRVPVVDREGRVVGVLGALDVLRWLAVD